MAISSTQFRQAMSNVAAHVYIAATDGSAGRRGVTVTSVCSVSDQPPTVLVCLNSENPFNQLFAENGVFSLNAIEVAHEDLANIFAGKHEDRFDSRFDDNLWSAGPGGSPRLHNAILSADCRIVRADKVATHVILIGEIIDLQYRDDGHPLLYSNRQYRRL